MHRRHLLSRLGGLICVSCVGMAQTNISPPSFRPAAVTTGVPTTVIVSALITSSGPTVLPNSVNVLQVDQNGNNAKVIETLNDNGLNGDSVAGDGIFGGLITLDELVTGEVYLQVSAAFQGVLRRTLSPIAPVLVTPAGVPNIPQPSSVVTTKDMRTGASVVCNEILVTFQPGTSQQSIDAAVQAIGGTLVGMLALLSQTRALFSHAVGCASMVGAV